MTTLALMGAGLLMGLAATPHCAAMCGTPCGLVARGCGGARPAAAMLAWQLGRATSYAAAGAIAAASIGLLAAAAAHAAPWRPAWAMLQAGLLVTGLWVAVAGRLPAVLDGVAQRVGQRLQGRVAGVASPTAGVVHWHRPGVGPASHGPLGASGGRHARGPVRAFALGMCWVGWPCGLLYGALAVAALADGAWQGAAVMLAFAAGSGLGPAALPWLANRLARRRGLPVLRLAGVLVALGAALSLAALLGPGEPLLAWCRSL